MLVEREIRHQPFEPGVFLFHLPQPAELAHPQTRILPFPGVEGRFAHAELPTQVEVWHEKAASEGSAAAQVNLNHPTPTHWEPS